MAADPFYNSTKSLPKTPDAQIVRVDMEQIDIGGRKEELPARKMNDMTVQHVANEGARK